MADEIRLVSIQRGYDPREFALVLLGGAGPVHGGRLAEELGIADVIVPEAPGVLVGASACSSPPSSTTTRGRPGVADAADLAAVERLPRASSTPRAGSGCAGRACPPRRCEVAYSRGHALRRPGLRARGAVARAARRGRSPQVVGALPRRPPAGLRPRARRPAGRVREPARRPPYRCRRRSSGRPRGARGDAGRRPRRRAPRPTSRPAGSSPTPVYERARLPLGAESPGRRSSSRPTPPPSSRRARRPRVDAVRQSPLRRSRERRERATRTIDPILLEVSGTGSTTIADEMELTLLRAPPRPIVKEGLDASAALFDVRGETIAQATAIPIHLGRLELAAAARSSRPSRRRRCAEGDAFLLNDPYDGGTHLPDVTLAVPVVRRRARRGAGVHDVPPPGRRRAARRAACRPTRPRSTRRGSSSRRPGCSAPGALDETFRPPPAERPHPGRLHRGPHGPGRRGPARRHPPGALRRVRDRDACWATSTSCSSARRR